MDSARCEIAVVGGGVVGSAAALGLTQAGFDVRLIERAAPPAPAADFDLRVYAVSPGSQRWLDALGVWHSLDAARVCAYEAMEIWGSQTARALHFCAADVMRAELGWIAEQSQLLHALWQALPGAVLCSNTQVQDVRFDDSGAQLQLGDGRGLRARLVLAAEGAHSPLRERAGIDIVDWSYEQHALVAHVSTAEPHRGVALQRFLAGGPLAFLPLADGRRSIVWSLPSEQAQRLRALPDEDFHRELAAAIQFRAGAVLGSTPRLLFPLRLLHAREYRRASLALLGDAAHVVHPLAGQGVNLGLGDAAELVAQLRGARERGGDWAGERVLARYERARKAANLEMLALTDALNRSFRVRSAGLPQLLDHGLAMLDRLTPVKQLLIRRALG